MSKEAGGRGWGRRLARAIAVVFCCGVAIGALGAAFLSYPQVFYRYQVSAGRLTLHADRPFDPAAGRKVLEDADGRLRRSGLAQGEGRHHVFVSHAPWRERLTFLWSYGAGGLNYYPLTRNVFLRDADIAKGLLLSSVGPPVAPPRTLAYFVAHEVAHSLTGEMIGPIAYARLPEWIREGVADYAAFAGTRADDLDAMAKRYLAGNDPAFGAARSPSYTRYRFLVAVLVERMGRSLADLITDPIALDEAEALVRGRLAARSS